MKEIWIVYDEAITKESRKGFGRSVRAFDSFDEAKKVMAERIAYYASKKSNPFGKKWSVLSSIEEILEEAESYDEISHEDKEKSLEYFLRYFEGDAGTLDVCFEEDGESIHFNSFSVGEYETTMWESTGSGFFLGVPIFVGTEFITVEINSFMMDNPDTKYYCYVRSRAEEFETPYYMYVSLAKTEVE